MIKKLHLKEADSDYVKIGNMVLPKNASSFGYADYDTVANAGKRAYNAEKDAERKEAERVAREAIAKEDIDTFERIYADYVEDNDINSIMSELFDAFVPSSGSAKNLGGELIRAIERIRYRDYNDGDKFYEGYGLETCGSCAAFIAENTDKHIDNFICSMAEYGIDGDISDEVYTRDLTTLAEKIIEYIADNLDVFAEPTQDCNSYTSVYLEDWEQASHCYEFEPDTSGEYLDRLMDADCISWEDVREFLEWQARDTGGEVNQWARDAFTITDLDKDEYQEWEDNWDRWWLSFLEDTMSEHEDELEDY